MKAGALNRMPGARVAVVTGASRGIGRAIAKRLASDGVAVAVNYAARESEAQTCVAEIVASGGHAVAVRADVSRAEDALRLYDETETAFGAVDILINNAGIMQSGLVTIAETDDRLYDRLFAVNARGTFNMLRLGAARVKHGGRIVNFSSSVVGLAPPGYAVYAAAKSAVETMTQIFAKELRGRNITVNALAPGPTATELFLEGKTDDMIAQAAKAPPLERLGTPEDIAEAVSFLVSGKGAWVNGQTIRVNGGIV